jgi:hypothetical protein
MDIWKDLDPGVYPWHPAPGNNLAHEYSNPLLISCPVATNTGTKRREIQLVSLQYNARPGDSLQCSRTTGENSPFPDRSFP